MAAIRRTLLAVLLAVLAGAADARSAQLVLTTQCGYEKTRVDLLAGDGSAEGRLFECAEYPRSPSWAPDGESLVYESGLDRVGFADDELTTASDILRGRSPAYAPDGEHLAFVRGRTIYVARVDGTDRRPLRRPEGGAGELHWSPDGALLVYWTTYHNVRLAETDDGEVVRRVAGRSYHPAGFSPDGRRILLVRSCARECHFGLYTVGVGGGRPQRLPRSPRRFIRSAAWSPDGRRIAAVVQSDPSGGFVRATVLTMRPDGSGKRVVLRSPRYKPRARNVTGIPRAVGWAP